MTSLGEQFARALAAKDHEQIRRLLHPNVDFRAMTPRRLWEASDPLTVTDEILSRWFEEHDHIDEVLWVDNDRLSDRERVGYRFVVHNDDGRFVTEQQAYYEVEGGVITWMRVLCSGWRPAE
jgi:hypothetical protein